MDFSVTNGLNGSLASQQKAKAYPRPQIQSSVPQEDNLPALVPSNTNTPQGTRLLNETRDELGDSGYRLTKTFERDDGRTFTKIEEFALTNRGARKSVVQQNPSGSVTQYEEVLDREPGGNFRRTQRFQDAGGEVLTNITADYKVTDPFVLTGGAALPAYEAPSPFNPSRGTQLDLRA